MKIWFGGLILGLYSVVGATIQLETKKNKKKKKTKKSPVLSGYWRFGIELMVVG